MANFHRNEIAGLQGTFEFRSLRDDLADLRAKAPAGVVDPTVIALPDKSEQGQNIHAMRLGKNPAMPILIAGCHHAREWISVEVPFLIAKFLIENYGTDAQVRRLVDASDIWIVPMVNPDGHEHSVLHERMWRKTRPTDPTRHAVDPNRNYDTTTWGSPTGHFSDTPSSDIYRGPSPGYAKEVIAMQNLITSTKFKVTLDYHSYGRFVLFPWAGRIGPHPDAKQDEMAAHLKQVIDTKGQTYTKIPASALYPQIAGVPPAQGVVTGGMLDFVVEHVPEAIAITVELEPGIDDPRGFALPESEIDPAFALHRASILTLLNCISTIRVSPPTRKLTLRQGAATDLTVFQQDCAKVFAAY
jgi:carboxypeptidase T